MVNVLPVFSFGKSNLEGASNGAEYLREAARYACEYHILIAHADTDAQTRRQVIATRFEPGFQLIAQLPTTEKVCPTIIPIIPDRMMEAWLLADIPALMHAIGTDMTEQELRIELKNRGVELPSRPHQVASIRYPKQTIAQIIKITHGSTHIGDESVYEAVARSLNLDLLEQVDAYHKFQDELEQQLKARLILHP